MDLGELNEIAQSIYREHFHEDFPGWVEWSNRMKRIAGNCRSDGRIALNKQYYERHGREEIILVLKHELAHLYCFKKIGKHSHNNPYFKQILEQLGGSKIGKMMPIKVHIYECPACKKQWSFKSRLKKYFSCAYCSNGKFNKDFVIKLVGEKIIEPPVDTEKSNF